MSATLRVGLLTGGGDCPGLNAVIRAVTKSLIIQHHAQIVGFEDGFEGLIRQRSRRLEYRDVSGILTLGGTILGTSNIANPFRYYGRGGADVSRSVLQYYHELGLDVLVAIGGDGTMSILHQLQEIGLRCIGVPKTIDNDLMGTDRTFGFDTAVAIAAEAIDRLHTTAQSHSRVMIIETMGRHAGWIALYAGVAGGADVILIPEIEYDIDEIVRVCREREVGGQHFTLIAVAEGARPRGGTQELLAGTDIGGNRRFGGIGYVLEEQLRGRIRSQLRTSILGHIQRGGTPTAFDRNLATAFGAYAAAMIGEGQSGRMVTLRDNDLGSIALSEVANRTRTVPLDAPMLAAAIAVGTSVGSTDFDVRLRGDADSGSVS
jgi:6-phosphofructokinase 1